MIDEILADFYEKCAPEPFEFGHIYYAATQYPPEELKLWRPVGHKNDVAKSYAVEFEVTAPKGDAFNRKYPLSKPLPLDIREEFIVVKAKPRPVVLLIPPQPINEPQQKGKGAVWRPHCLVAPVFSLSFPHTEEEKFSPEFRDRLRKLEFPQLLFMPKHEDVLKVDSVLRLDECQSIPVNGLRPMSLSLSKDVKALLRSQFSFLVNGLYEGDYQVYRDLIREEFA
jgi:hypothetical protein